MSKHLKNLYSKNPRAWVEALVWLLVTVFVVVAKTIYYANAHSLTSPWMGNAWIYPFGVFLLDLVLAFLGQDLGAYPRLVFNAGNATIIVYLFLMGVYEMASNYNELTPLFFYLGLLLVIFGFLWGMIALFLRNKKNMKAVRE
jgi:hypothetical protein